MLTLLLSSDSGPPAWLRLTVLLSVVLLALPSSGITFTTIVTGALFPLARLPSPQLTVPVA